MRKSFSQMLFESRDAKAEYDNQENQAYSLVKELSGYLKKADKALKSHRKDFEKNPKNWGYIGDLGELVHTLESTRTDISRILTYHVKEELNTTITEKKLPKSAEFYKQYVNLPLDVYARYWALFAFMYDLQKDNDSNDDIDATFQMKYDDFKKKGKKYLDAWKYFTAYKRQELVGKTEGTWVFETKSEEVTFAFQLNLRDEYIKNKETKQI